MKSGRRRNSVLSLVGLLLSGCSMLGWDGDGKSSGLVDPCPKDVQAIQATWASPPSCVTSDTCITGTYCDTSKSVCKFDCITDSDCGNAGLKCSCRGTCEGTGTPGTTSTTADPTCPRVRDGLLGMRTEATGRSCTADDQCPYWWTCSAASKTCVASTCVYDEDCPYGSACVAGACAWSCLDTKDVTYGCPAATVCDCTGACRDNTDGARPEGALARLEVSPTSMPVAAGVAWAPRRVTVSLVTANADVQSAATTAAVTAQAGEGLEVSCNAGEDGLATTATYGASCALGTQASDAWVFALLGEMHRATKPLWVRQKSYVAPAVLPSAPWTVTISSTRVGNAPQSVVVAPPEVLAGGSGTGAETQPLDGEYTGELVLLGASASTTSLGWSSADSLRVPVKAWVTAAGIDFVDELKILSPTGTLQARKETARFYTWLVPAGAGSALADAEGPVVARVYMMPLAHDPTKGTLSSRLVVELSAGLVYWEYQLRRVGPSVICSQDSCPQMGYTCEKSLGVCTSGSEWEPVSAYPTQLVHTKSERFVAVLAGLMKFLQGNTAGWATYQDRFASYLYDAAAGFVAPLLQGHRKTMGATFLRSPLPSTGANLCVRDLSKWVSWAQSQKIDLQPVAIKYITAGSFVMTWQGPSSCSSFYSTESQALNQGFNEDWAKRLAPCIYPTAAVNPPGSMGRLPAGPTASCQKVFETYRNAVSPPYTAPSTMDTFLGALCQRAEEKVGLQVGTSNVEPYYVWLCPFAEGLYGPIDEATQAQRLLCYDPEATGYDALSSTGSILESRDFGTTVLPVSGDLVCGQDQISSGVELLTLQDRSNALDLPQDPLTIISGCLADLAAEPADLAVSDSIIPLVGTVQDYLHAYFKKTQCFRPANFYAALHGLAQSMAPSNMKIGKLYVRLVQQWLFVHQYLATEGREQWRQAQMHGTLDSGSTSVPGSALPPTLNLEGLLQQLEAGWNLLLARRYRDQLMLVSPDALLQPDYRAEYLAVVPTEPQREHKIGLPVGILDGFNGHLRLLADYLQWVGQESYGQCHEGGQSSLRQAALERAGRVLRYAVAAESLARALYDRATITACGTCAAGSTCTEGRCVLPSGEWVRRQHMWAERWSSAYELFRATRQEVVGKLASLAACENPLGISDADLPLYFGDPTGDTSRFFASSDYLTREWAIPVVASAKSHLLVAREAWTRRNDAQVNGDRVLEQRKSEYGTPIVQMCGLTEIESKDVLDAFAAGTYTPESCYVNRQNPACTGQASELYKRIRPEIVKYQLCLWKELQGELGLDPSSSEITAATKCQSVTVAPDAGTFTCTLSPSGAVTLPLTTLYNLRAMAGMASGIDRARAQCMAGGVERELPDRSDAQSQSNPDCYRGLLGESLQKIEAARISAKLALTSWKTEEEVWKKDMNHCFAVDGLMTKQAKLYQTFVDDQKELIQARLDAEKKSAWWSFASSAFSTAASATAAIAGLALVPATGGASLAITAIALANGAGTIASVVATQYGNSAKEKSAEMEAKRLDFEKDLAAINAQLTVMNCFHEADKVRMRLIGYAMQVERAEADVKLALTEFANMQRSIQQKLMEGRAAVLREKSRYLKSTQTNFWLNESVQAFLTEFTWAKRLMYLALRSVEYEYQQSLPLRGDILSAKTPDQLNDVMRAMQREQLTRTINTRRPEEATLVLSLRTDILGLSDRMSTATRPGARPWTAKERFQKRLWSPEYQLRDDQGRYLGQGVPFHVSPIGPLKLRCGERLWRVSATVQGDLPGVETPSVPMFLMKRNHFGSQWCQGKGDGSLLQTGAVQPASSLFPAGEQGGAEAQRLPFLTAMLQPWFNIRRSEFYRAAYAEGASDELAGRGLYGEYVLLFPWHGLLENGFDLDRVEDVLIRFDYLSVDNISVN